MDGFLRPLLAALSSRPELAKWLATDDLVRQLAAAIESGVGGASPARDFKVIAPASPFVPAGRGGAAPSIRPAIDATTGWCDRHVDRRVERREDLQDDPAAAQRGVPAAWAIPPATSIARLQQTLDILLDTPVVKDPIALVEGDGAGWVYVDDELEELAPTQKQLLRMGSANVDRLLVWLRALQAALE